MPLLKRKAFEKSAESQYLRDDDEVFHCEITDEIFKNYEEYCERIILVNSMVWTCEMTGKNNLTYAEALESEKAARKLIKDFPIELRVPILFLATKTNRSSFQDMSEDIFGFVRERYFIGETVEACLEQDAWKEAHILSITVQNDKQMSGSIIPASSYTYEVEQYDQANPAAMGQIVMVPHDCIRRTKGVYSREKNRLFLKQFVELNPNGIFSVKKSALDKYSVHKITYDQMSAGEPPIFPSSKKLIKSSLTPTNGAKLSSFTKGKPKISPDKKGKQETMDKYFKKAEKGEGPKPAVMADPQSTKKAQDLLEKMRKAEELMKQRKELEKTKKKEKAARLQAYLKEWQKIKDDLDLEDHKTIPPGTPINVAGIPHKYFGDFLAVLEFVHVYSDTLKAKDVFHNGLDIEMLRKALTVKEHAGMFCDLLQMFLTAIFSLQEDESEEYNENGRIQESTQVNEVSSELGTSKAVELATAASKWSQTYLATPLSCLQIDPTTVTEVLRLHLLSSGGTAGARCATWRYQQRGGYTSADDPGLRLRISNPELIRRLATHHVAELTLHEKFTLLQCLMSQMLTYAALRDIVEEKLEVLRNTKHKLKTMQVNERKREAQVLASKQEIKKEFAAKVSELKLTGENASEMDQKLKAALEKLAKDNEAKRMEYTKAVGEMQTELFDYVSYVGMDRAYRRYWLNQRVAGLFVEAGDEPRGPCRRTPMPPPARDLSDPLTYVASLYEKERGGSDKENDSGANSRTNSPQKPTVNGLPHKPSPEQVQRELYVCTGDPNNCLVHGKGDMRPYWWVYHTPEQIDGLIQSLNKRGIRESELRHNLESDKANILQYLTKCPVHWLNPDVAPPPVQSSRLKKWQPSLVVPEEYTVSEAVETSLREHILELEEKIFLGCLGSLRVKDREAWRGTILVNSYDKQEDYLSWGPGKRYRDDYHLPNGVLQLPMDVDQVDANIAENKYRDPGHYLDTPRLNGVNGDEDRGAKPEVVRSLASALLQVAQGIHSKYLKRPLGLDDKERKEREAKGKSLEPEALERWEVSLMECRSFSMLVLHLLVLDSSISWAASVLHASCRVCRRKTDPDSMLLCDGCNKGHHLYCLKPKLAKVPQGDWYCEQCRPKERTPRKQRKVFIEKLEDSASEAESDDSVDGGVCAGCGSGGRRAAGCVACGARYHAECADPPVHRNARRWTCAVCLAPTRDSEDSEEEQSVGELRSRRSRSSKDVSPVPNNTKKRGRKPKETVTTNSNTKRSSKQPLTNGLCDDNNSSRKRSSRFEVVHTELLETLLKDVMKHKDCWPFYEPVSTEDVPDYLDIIEHPMDFSTIRDKLSRGHYDTDNQMIDDAALVFINCYTYNKDSHPVAKAGCRLEKYFKKRCAELQLPSLPEINLEAEDTSSKRRISEDEERPTKKPKIK